MQQQRGRRFIQNEFHQVSEHCQLLLPKQLTLEEYKWLVSQPVPFHAVSVSNNHAVIFSMPPEVEMAERKYFDLEKLQQQCVAKCVQLCSYKPLGQAGVFRKEETKIKPIVWVSEYHQGQLTGPNYDPEDMCQNANDVVKLVTDLVELCAETNCQYIHDFDMSGEVTANYFNPFSLANLEAPLFADKSVNGIKGLNIPFNYYGCPNSSTPMHLDDYGLSTTSFHVAGATKIWITIAPKDKLRFQKLVE
ncbi:unnamed protein product, partial [Allacma fusca]